MLKLSKRKSVDEKGVLYLPEREITVGASQ